MTDAGAVARDAGAGLPVASGCAVARCLARLTRGLRWPITAAVALFVVDAVLALVLPLAVGAFVDGVVGTGGGLPDGFPWIAAGIAAAAVASGLVLWGGTALTARAAERVVARLRERFVARVLRLPRSVDDRGGVADAVTRATDDVAHVSGVLPGVLPEVVGAVCTLAVVGGGLAVVDPRFLAAFALVVPFHLLTLRWYLRHGPSVYAAERAATSGLGRALYGTVANLDAVAAHDLASRRRAIVRTANWTVARWSMRGRIVQNRLTGRLLAVEGAGLVGVLGTGLWLAVDGAVTAGAVTAAALLYLRTVQPIEALLRLVDQLQSAVAALARLVGVLDADVPAVSATPSSRTAASGGRAGADEALVRLAGAGFGYPGGEDVLHDIDLAVRSHETLAVVGVTGSGKTTLAGLVSGALEPSRGRIERRLGTRDIATVAQEAHVFAGTLRENLSLARDDATDEDIAGALAATGADAVVASSPDGLDTRVGDGGHALSPADAQLVALARVHLLDPALVVLDEATADAETADASVLEAAAQGLTRGRAAVVIAHRLTQAAAADRIVVLDRGRVVERGTHAELRDAGGPYARLWAAWSIGRPGRSD